MKQMLSNLRVYAVFFVGMLLDVLGATFTPPHASPFGWNRATRRQSGAVVVVKSTVITNADALPIVINKGFLARARGHFLRGVCTVTNGDSIASVYRYGRVKSNDLVQRVFFDGAACGAGCQLKIGLLETVANGSGVAGGLAGADALFATALDVSGALRATDVTRQSGTITVANMEKRVWELLGLAKDPMTDYDIAATIMNAGAGATAATCITAELAPAAG